MTAVVYPHEPAPATAGPSTLAEPADPGALLHAGELACHLDGLLSMAQALAERVGDHLGPDARTELLRWQEVLHQAAVVARRLAIAAAPACDAGTVLADLQPSLVELCGRDVELWLDVDARPALVALGSRQMEQLVLNLALHARDGMPDGGMLSLTLRVVEPGAMLPDRPSELGDGHWARLRVVDTGPGLTDGWDGGNPLTWTSRGPLGAQRLFGAVSAVRQAGGALVASEAPGGGIALTAWLPMR